MSRRTLLWRVAACAAVVVLLGLLVSRSPSMATAGGTDAASAPSAEVPPPVQAPPPWQPFQAQALKAAGLELGDTPLELAFACSWTFNGRASHTDHDDEL